MAVGSNTQFLTANSAQASGLEWITQPNPTVTTTKGDIIVRDASNDIRVGVGSNDQILVADSVEASGIKWADNNVNLTVEEEDTPVGTAFDTLNFLGSTTTASDATGGVCNVSIDPIVTTKGDLMTHSTVPVRIGVGTNGQILVADSVESAGVKWEDPGAAMNLTVEEEGTPVGTAFNTLNYIGSQITAVDATGGTCDITVNSVVAVKGDILTYSTVPAKLEAGANDQLLVADSSESTGLKWVDASSAVSFIGDSNAVVTTFVFLFDESSGGTKYTDVESDFTLTLQWDTTEGQPSYEYTTEPTSGNINAAARIYRDAYAIASSGFSSTNSGSMRSFFDQGVFNSGNGFAGAPDYGQSQIIRWSLTDSALDETIWYKIITIALGDNVMFTVTKFKGT